MTSTHAQAYPARNNHFNLLRLIFAVLVILSHSFELVDGNRSRELLTWVFGTLSFGEFAVDGFFLLSGYLIVQSWESSPRPSRFLKKRALRIYPGFIVASLVSAFIVGPLGADAAQYFSAFQGWGFVRDVVLLRVPFVPPVFQGQPSAYVNGPMWTIAFEVKCYLLVMLLGMVGLVKHRRGWLAISACLFLLATIQNAGYRFEIHGRQPEMLGPMIRLANLFFVGGCFYLFREKIRMTRQLALLAAIVLCAGMFIPHYAELVLALFGGYLLFFFAFLRIPGLLRFNDLPDVSYGLYLYGWPVQKLLIWYVPGISPWSVLFLSLVLSLLLAVISWYAIEEPFLKLKGTRLALRGQEAT